MENLKFQYPWREYQQRILDELDGHFDDEHLHIVAAPGSGKTILGLEVMRQLNVPTLILAPTITIRNQWIDRLSMFMPEGSAKPNWISKDLKKPKKLTVVTYQALHAAFSGEKTVENIGEIETEEENTKNKIEKKQPVVKVIELLKKQGLKAIILDEAHHLRKEWWKALMKLKASLKEVQIVSLTATPPYDVEYAEWQKYEALCGPIDTEISIPELVLQGDLCPHQDYVHFSLLQEKEAEKFRQFKTDIWGFLEKIKLDENFLNIFSVHPWINDTKNHVEDILSEPAFFSAMIIFMNAADIKPPKYALNVLGAKRSDIPALSAKWLEVLFTGILYTHVEQFKEQENIVENIRKQLKQIGAIERKKVVIDNTKEIKKLLASSLGKLDSILEITTSESKNLGNNLRMVILADYIRKTEMPSAKGGEKPINKIGVVPIFEYLRRASISNIKLGVLTGSLIILPKTAKETLIKIAQKNNIDEKHLKFYDLMHDDNFIRINIAGENRQKIVHIITEVFNSGAITTLVGTQALLGEGWDAPSVNTLILASYVGSYMLSNQMRGRAIRTDPNQPDKTANIWHLVALDIETIEEKIKTWVTGESNRQQYFDPFSNIKTDLGHDIKTLYRRFRAFEGLSFATPPVIENGFKRLGLSKAKWDKNGIKKTNKLMLTRAEARDKLPKLWNEALIGKTIKPKLRELLETNNAPKGLAFADTLKYLIINALIAGAAWGGQIIRAGSRESDGFFLLLFIALGIAFIVSAPKLFKAFWLFYRNGSIAGSVKQVGWCVLETLHNMKIIKTNIKNIEVRTVKNDMGVVYCRLDGATNVETKYFLEAMEEILNPINSPRYLMIRKSNLYQVRRIDYHAVPKIIGQNKKNALYFAKKWKRYIGYSELIYTRNPKGRMILLKARTKALSSNFRKKTDRISAWE